MLAADMAPPRIGALNDWPLLACIAGVDSAVVLAYLLHQPMAVVPVIGADRSDQLDDSLSALNVSLSIPELQLLEDAAGSGIRHG